VTTNGGPVRLLINQGRPGHHWLQLSLQQSNGNVFALGARAGLERAGASTLWRRVRTDGSYLSASDARMHFGLGADTRIDGVVVQWPDGASERWTHITADRTMSLKRGTGSPLPDR
jgi:hypothetical protein